MGTFCLQKPHLGGTRSPGHGRSRGQMSLPGEPQPIGSRHPPRLLFRTGLGSGGRSSLSPLHCVRSGHTHSPKKTAAYRGCPESSGSQSGLHSVTGRQRSHRHPRVETELGSPKGAPLGGSCPVPKAQSCRLLQKRYLGLFNVDSWLVCSLQNWTGQPHGRHSVQPDWPCPRAARRHSHILPSNELLKERPPPHHAPTHCTLAQVGREAEGCCP